MVFSPTLFFIALAVAAVVLIPLAWVSLRERSESRQPASRLALVVRGLGILFIVFAIADPQIVEERPVKGANIVALLADNSAGLRIKDNAAILDRGETMRQYLAGRNASWISELKDDFQIRDYHFDRTARRSSGYESMDFEGQYSSIAGALVDIADRLEGRPLAGIVLFSDGVATDDPLSEQQLAQLPPIFPVVVGEMNSVPDIAIRDVKLSQSAFGDSLLELDARIVQSGLAEQAVRTQLRRIAPVQSSSANERSLPSQLLDERVQTIAGEDSVSFEWKAPGGGIQFFELSTEALDPKDSEATTANNKRLFAVDRGPEKYRLLYVTGRPNWEYKFLNRALSEDPQLDVVGLIRVASREPNFEFKGRAGENSNALYRGFGREDETERYDESVLIRMNARDAAELKTGFPGNSEELFAYDAIIIDDLEADFFSFSQQTLIREFVKQRGGGLLVLGGVNALEDGRYENTPIAQALPVYLDTFGPSAATERLVRWNLTRSGWVEPWMRIRSFETEERQRIQAMPWLRVYNTLQRVKPGAQTLATIEDALGETYPALVTQRFGSGRVATLAIGDLWRWGMQDAQSQADLAQFWRQTSRWLVADNPSRVELSARRVGDSSVVVAATARDKDYHPLQLGIAELTVRRVDEPQREQQYTLRAVSEQPGQFQIELPLNETGAFTAEVIVRTPEGTLLGQAQTAWVNEPLVAEFASLSPGLSYLQRIAAGTGGTVLQLSELGRLRSALEAKSSPVMEAWSKPLWHNGALFLLALACFLAEWLLRRRRGLA